MVSINAIVKEDILDSKSDSRLASSYEEDLKKKEEKDRQKEKRKMSNNNYMNPPMASRNNCENFSGDQEQWRNCNPGRNMGYYPYASNYNLNYGTPYGGMYPMGNSMAACDTTNTVYGRTTPQVTMNNSYPATTCLADSSDNMPYDMTNSSCAKHESTTIDARWTK